MANPYKVSLPISRLFHALMAMITADYLLVATGNSTNSDLAKQFDASTVDNERQIKVRPTLQLAAYDHIFAVGDVCDIKEIKTTYNGSQHAPVVAANIASLLKGGQASKTYSTGAPMMMVTLGP